MSLPLKESQAITDLANFLYDFLPGTPHPYADPSISFAGVAQSSGLGNLWRGGSKLPAVTALLEQTLDTRRDRFCDLMIGIVRKSIVYRNKKGSPITREEIQQLNGLITKVDFKIPELWDPRFLDTLPSLGRAVSQQPEKLPELKKLKDDLLRLTALPPHDRGFAFERCLNTLFRAFSLEPRGPFRLIGEQIDGSFELDHEIYLLEAKWHNQQTKQPDLLVLREKVDAKATWARGVFISYSGFTLEGLDAFSRGRPTNLIGISGQDLFFILDEKMSLPEILRKKVRLAAETGRFYIPVQEIILQGKK